MQRQQMRGQKQPNRKRTNFYEIAMRDGLV